MIRLDKFNTVEVCTYTRDQANQCDQIGRFLKVLGNKFCFKSSPKYLVAFRLFWKTSLLKLKPVWVILFNVKKKLGYFFTNIWSHWAQRKFAFITPPRGRPRSFFNQNKIQILISAISSLVTVKSNKLARGQVETDQHVTHVHVKNIFFLSPEAANWKSLRLFSSLKLKNFNFF